MPSVNIYTIVDYLAKLLNVSAYNDVIYNGIQIEGNRPISNVATAVTASLYAIEQAEALHADLLITHHGLFLKNSLHSIQGILRERVAQTLSSGLHLLTYHLPLDAHEEYGNAWPFARALGWEGIEGFGEVSGKKIGVRGNLKEIVAAQHLFKILELYWNVQGVFLGQERPVKNAAFVSGSGHRMLQEAISCGADCLITGTADNASWNMVQESKIVMMVFGHYATERLGVQLLGQHIADVFGLQHRFIEEKNPF
jgi:dinuclear metal center YbgI/SA1388 family protein